MRDGEERKGKLTVGAVFDSPSTNSSASLNPANPPPPPSPASPNPSTPSVTPTATNLSTDSPLLDPVSVNRSPRTVSILAMG